MSNDPSDSSEGADTGLDLSSLNFGPAWARDDKESKSLKKFKDRGDRDDSRRGGGRRDGGGGGGGGQRRGDRRDHRGGGGGGGGGKFQGKGGKGRGRFQDRRHQRTEVPAPEGFTVKLMPLEESLDLLAKEIMQTGRTYSVFDLAKVCLQGRDRFRVTFENKDQKFFRCREDHSVWLTKEEARRQIWRGDWLKKFYIAVQSEGDAPKGSFSSVAKCGISGELLGPPNYHGYQQNIATLHRERFGHMSLDQYKSKINMEHGEEAVQAWLESMKTVTKWRETTEADLIKEAEAAAKTKVEAEKSSPDESSESPVEETPKEEAATDETAADETAADEIPGEETVTENAIEPETPASETDETPSEPETSEAESDPDTAGEEDPVSTPEPEVEVVEAPLFETSREVEQHFLKNHFDQVFEETNRAWVLGDIKGNLLSPGLLTLLKNTVQEEKRYPANLMPVVCRQLSGRHVAVYKWEKKLKVGPSRPHAASDDLQLAERPQAILTYLKENTGKKLAELWEIVLPKDASDEHKREWYHDLHWLLNQGHAILLNDTTLHIAKSPASQPQQPKKKAPKKAAKNDGGSPGAVSTETSTESQSSTDKASEPEAKEAKTGASESEAPKSPPAPEEVAPAPEQEISSPAVDEAEAETKSKAEPPVTDSE